MDAGRLVAKFAAKTAATVVQRDKQTAIAADNNAKRLDDVEHCKRQLADAVIPFLEELQTLLPKEQFSLRCSLISMTISPLAFIQSRRWLSNKYRYFFWKRDRHPQRKQWVLKGRRICVST